MEKYYTKLIITIVFTLFLSISQVFAQLHNTTFTTLPSGTRSSTADKGAVYYLDGNTTNGRLNIGTNAIWEVGDNTHILVNGNPNHSYMNGIIKASGLVYVGTPTGGGRLDFSSPNGGLEAHDMTYYYTGNGDIFNHLENQRNQYTGFVRFIIDMTGGNAFIQLANREYANIALDVRSSNVATLNIYPARSHNGFTSLPGFTTRNFTGTLLLLKGTTGTSHGRFYDPVYEGVANNLLSMNIDTGGTGNFAREYFTIDVTNIQDNDTKIRVTDNTPAVQYNDIPLSVANTTLYAYDGTTPLNYYSGRNVLPILVRTIGTSTSTTRNTISYLIRRVGYQEIRVDNLAINNPVVIQEILIDNAWSNTGTITEISNLDELYDEAKKTEFNDLTLSTLISANGTALDLGNRNLVIDATAASALAVNTGTNTITIRANTLVGGTKFASIKTTGLVSTLNGGTLEFGYIDSSGTNKFINLEWPTGFSSLVVSVVNLDDNTEILGPTSTTTTFKSHFLIPDPAPTNGVDVRIITANGTILYQEDIPEDDLNFIDLNVILNNASTEENQAKMLRLSERLLTKVEAINNSLTDATTPSITVNETVTNNLDAGTLQNQEAILNILRRLLNKISANREILKEN